MYSDDISATLLAAPKIQLLKRWFRKKVVGTNQKVRFLTLRSGAASVIINHPDYFQHQIKNDTKTKNFPTDINEYCA